MVSAVGGLSAVCGSLVRGQRDQGREKEGEGGERDSKAVLCVASVRDSKVVSIVSVWFTVCVCGSDSLCVTH